MKAASLLTSMSDVKKMLKEINLLKADNRSRRLTMSPSKFSYEFIQLSQSSEYEKLYMTAMENADYDFLLVDNSFLQFSCENKPGSDDTKQIRYAYYPNPRYHKTYEEFLLENDLSLEECGTSFEQFYEQDQFEARIKAAVTPVRYDFDLDRYVPKIHPISHLHIGHEEDMRIAVSKVIAPQKFVSFVIRMFYYDIWKKAINSNQPYNIICDGAKQKCITLSDDVFNEETTLLYLA